MRILVYGINHSPELTGIGKYTGEMVQWVTSQGHEVRVVTAPPYYPAWKVDPPYNAGRYSVEQLDGAKVYRCPLWVPQKPGGRSRVAHLLSFMLSSLPVMLAQILWRPDAIFTVMPTLLCGPATLAVARLTGASTWLHVQDFEVDNAFDLGILPAQGFIRLLALAFEKFFMGCFDRVSTISPNMVQRAIDKGVDKKHVLLFPNWVDTDAIHPQPRPNSLRRELGISEEDVVLLYSGNMGMKQGMEILPTLARHFASEPHVKFLFCGDGAFRPQLEQLVSGLANVMLLPLQPVERLNDLLNTADIHLLPQRAEAADLVMPSKLTGMLASGRPVIATAAPDTQVAHVVEGRGIAVPVQDMDAIYAAVRHLVNHPAERRSMGEAARAYAVECLGSQHVLARFTAEMEKLAVQHPD